MKSDIIGLVSGLTKTYSSSEVYVSVQVDKTDKNPQKLRYGEPRSSVNANKHVIRTFCLPELRQIELRQTIWVGQTHPVTKEKRETLSSPSHCTGVAEADEAMPVTDPILRKPSVYLPLKAFSILARQVDSLAEEDEDKSKNNHD